jgi:hypothetical protein
VASLRRPVRKLRSSLGVTLLFAIECALLLVGCSKTLKADDPQLKPIRDTLEASLPAGTTEGAVNRFLETHGYPTEPSDKPGTIVAIIRHTDTEELRPVTARVTFYFDANGKLNTYEIVRTMNGSVPQ